MELKDLVTMVENTLEPAFVADNNGEIIAWNSGVEAIFGLSAAEAVGNYCDRILKGEDDCGPVCTAGCAIQQAARDFREIASFSLKVETPQGLQWSKISVLLVKVSTVEQPYSVHTLCLTDNPGFTCCYPCTSKQRAETLNV